MVEVKNALNNPAIRKDFGVAPAEPLVLMDIIYNFGFKPDADQIKKFENLENRIISKY